MHCLGVIAERQFHMRHIEAATTTWNTFLDETVSSARGDQHLTTLLISLPQHRRIVGVRELETRARHVAALKRATT